MNWYLFHNNIPLKTGKYETACKRSDEPMANSLQRRFVREVTFRCYQPGDAIVACRFIVK